MVYKTLSRTNNHAARLVVSGQYKEAYSELRQAMQTQAAIVSQVKQGRMGWELTSRVPEICALDSEQCGSETNDQSMFPWPLTLTFRHQDTQDQATAISCSCATALFNMGLVCHRNMKSPSTTPERHQKLLHQARRLYVKSYEIGRAYEMPLLALAVCNNLMELSFEEDADLTAVRVWDECLADHINHVPDDFPEALLLHFWKAHLYFSANFVAARAA
mmetsp:Transcript_1215/g.2646  ORF Transcript_1215/g.2646 Transcript_1215/m.2646 type:complete len:218 (+) Transcript_1215:81-734(+)|eukprot:scaffold9857_cov195-Amphora_coffeaeformis.AAC.2